MNNKKEKPNIEFHQFDTQTMAKIKKGEPITRAVNTNTRPQVIQVAKKIQNCLLDAGLFKSFDSDNNKNQTKILFNLLYETARLVLIEKERINPRDGSKTLKETKQDIKSAIRSIQKTSKTLSEIIKTDKNLLAASLSLFHKEKSNGSLELKLFQNTAEEAAPHFEKIITCLKNLDSHIKPGKKAEAKAKNLSEEILINLGRIYELFTGECPKITLTGDQLSSNEKNKFNLFYQNFCNFYINVTSSKHFIKHKAAYKIIKKNFKK